MKAEQQARILDAQRLLRFARAVSRPWVTLQVLYTDFLDVKAPLRPEPLEHLHLAMAWLCRAQDSLNAGGIPAAYDRLWRRWEPPYPETTGYLIPTFLRYALIQDDQASVERAIRMADWLVSLQAPDGSFPAPPPVGAGTSLGDPCVFDTGMILEGLTEIAHVTAHSRFSESAIRAARWLKQVQDPDGAWSRYDYYGAASTYHAKVGASLARHGEHERDVTSTTSAVRHADWVIRHQDETGWFRRADFGGTETPWLHTVAYVIEGLLDIGTLTSAKTYVESARKAAWQLLRCFEVRRHLPGRLAPSWKPACRSRCLPGEAQMAVVWLKLYRHSGDVRFLNAAVKVNDGLRQVQCVAGPNEWRGAIAGSRPFSRGYAAWQYPNWAAKFFCDSLMLEHELLDFA